MTSHIRFLCWWDPRVVFAWHQLWMFLISKGAIVNDVTHPFPFQVSSESVVGRCTCARTSSTEHTLISLKPSRTMTNPVVLEEQLVSSTLYSQTCSWSQVRHFNCLRPISHLTCFQIFASFLGVLSSFFIAYLGCKRILCNQGKQQNDAKLRQP